MRTNGTGDCRFEDRTSRQDELYRTVIGEVRAVEVYEVSL